MNPIMTRWWHNDLVVSCKPLICVHWFFQMWSYWVNHKGYHFRKKKTRMKEQPWLTPRQWLFSCVVAACSLLLTSSVRVASEAMQPRLVELWKCRVQHLRKYYCVQKYKQREQSAISVNVWYCPLILSLCLTIMIFTSVWALLLNSTMKIGTLTI